MNILIVAAHPDDEILGAGGTVFRLTEQGNRVSLCVLCGNADNRSYRPSTEALKENMNSATASIGISEIYCGTYKDSNLNVYPHNDIVRFIEDAIFESHSSVIITHHPADLNNDHKITSLYAQEAARISMRQTVPAVKLNGLVYMEVPSSTDWSFGEAAERFCPNTFIEIGEDGVKAKLEALKEYGSIMRKFPHPRSKENIKALASLRGGQSDTVYAEAFQTAFWRV